MKKLIVLVGAFSLIGGCASQSASLHSECTSAEKFGPMNLSIKGYTGGKPFEALNHFENDFKLLKEKKGFNRVESSKVSVGGIAPVKYTLAPYLMCKDGVEVFVEYRNETLRAKVSWDKYTQVYDDRQGDTLELMAMKSN